MYPASLYNIIFTKQKRHHIKDREIVTMDYYEIWEGRIIEITVQDSSSSNNSCSRRGTIQLLCFGAVGSRRFDANILFHNFGESLKAQDALVELGDAAVPKMAEFYSATAMPGTGQSGQCFGQDRDTQCH